MVVIDVSMICTIMYIGQEHTFLFLFFSFIVNLIDKIKEPVVWVLHNVAQE